MTLFIVYTQTLQFFTKVEAAIADIFVIGCATSLNNAHLKEKNMPVYLKMEEVQNGSNDSLASDLMGLSSLALLLSPWALIALALFAFNIHFITMDMVMISSIILMASLPKLFQLLTPVHKEPECITQT